VEKKSTYTEETNLIEQDEEEEGREKKTSYWRKTERER